MLQNLITHLEKKGHK